MSIWCHLVIETRLCQMEVRILGVFGIFVAVAAQRLCMDGPPSQMVRLKGKLMKKKFLKYLVAGPHGLLLIPPNRLWHSFERDVHRQVRLEYAKTTARSSARRSAKRELCHGMYSKSYKNLSRKRTFWCHNFKETVHELGQWNEGMGRDCRKGCRLVR